MEERIIAVFRVQFPPTFYCHIFLLIRLFFLLFTTVTSVKSPTYVILILTLMIPMNMDKQQTEELKISQIMGVLETLDLLRVDYT